ncbi:MAG: DUF1559 domain-containing protein [Planctomycetales bacterium]
MEHHFPPTSSETVVRHYALLAWLALLLGLFVWRLFRTVRGWEPLVWLPGVLLITLIFLHRPDADVVPFRPGLTMAAFLAALGVALVGCIVSAARLKRQGRAGWALAAMLVGSGSVAVTCLLPAISRAGAAARRSTCKSNIRSLGVAMHDWYDQHDRLPDVDCAAEGSPPVSWRVAILPLVGQAALRGRYDDAKPWNDSANLEIARDGSNGWFCPSNYNPLDDHGRRFSAYVMVTGPRTVAPGGKGLSFREITDGLSNTLLLVEAAGLNVVWTEPRDFDAATQPIGVNLPGGSPGHSPGLLSSYHGGGANAVFGDHSVHFVLDDTDPRVLEALTTATGGEDVGELEW